MKPIVLYEDNHLIAVYKPAGIVVQGDNTGDTSLMDIVKQYLKETYHKPGNVFLGLLHRLDRPVAGIVLFAKTSKGASRLSEQWRNHTVQKIYHARVEIHPQAQIQQEGTLIHYLKKDNIKNKVTVYHQPQEGALRAELSYRIEKKEGQTARVRIILKTGRPHQIRAQFAAIGCPLVGDTKYGGAAHAKTKGTIALIASELHVTAATEQKDIHIMLPQSLQTI